MNVNPQFQYMQNRVFMIYVCIATEMIFVFMIPEYGMIPGLY